MGFLYQSKSVCDTNYWGAPSSKWFFLFVWKKGIVHFYAVTRFHYWLMAVVYKGVLGEISEITKYGPFESLKSNWSFGWKIEPCLIL